MHLPRTVVFAMIVAFAAHSVAHAVGLEGYENISLQRAPHSSVEYYYVNAIDERGLAQQLTTRGPMAPSGVRFHGYTFWKVSWRWDLVDSVVEPESVRCELRARVVLPRWKPLRPVSDRRLLDRWRRFTYALARHEQRHLDNVLDHYDEPCAQIRAAARRAPLSPREANHLGQLALDKLRAFDEQYDLMTNHGFSEGAHFP